MRRKVKVEAEYADRCLCVCMFHNGFYCNHRSTVPIFVAREAYLANRISHLVSREAYLANKDATRSFSVLRFTLHEIRFTKITSPDNAAINSKLTGSLCRL